MKHFEFDQINRAKWNSKQTILVIPARITQPQPIRQIEAHTEPKKENPPE